MLELGAPWKAALALRGDGSALACCAHPQLHGSVSQPRSALARTDPALLEGYVCVSHCAGARSLLRGGAENQTC